MSLTNQEVEGNRLSFQRFLELGATFTYPIIFFGCLWMPVLLVIDHGLYWALPLLLIAGWASADFLTGLAHWAFDTYGTTETPLLGKSFIQPFREHHVDPQGICTHDIPETIGNSAIGAVPVHGTLWLFVWLYQESLTFALVSIWLSLTFGLAVVTNLFHRWAHADEVPGYVEVLQKMRLILPKQHHDIHHTTPHRDAYCITCGWMNPFLDKVRFFRGVEWVLARFGLRPAEGVEDPH